MKPAIICMADCLEKHTDLFVKSLWKSELKCIKATCRPNRYGRVKRLWPNSVGICPWNCFYALFLEKHLSEFKLIGWVGKGAYGKASAKQDFVYSSASSVSKTEEPWDMPPDFLYAAKCFKVQFQNAERMCHNTKTLRIKFRNKCCCWSKTINYFPLKSKHCSRSARYGICETSELNSSPPSPIYLAEPVPNKGLNSSGTGSVGRIKSKPHRMHSSYLCLIEQIGFMDFSTTSAFANKNR